ncbi:MAG: hypothetical protein NTW62_03175 [Candidatus Nomurabacteria bacterium]|nr:hypothetical protein [Candidatus Nomurabacteria bacterium]
MTSIGDYNTIMSDRNIFNQIVYTPLSEALRLLEERQKDPVLIARIEELLNGDIPEVLKNKKCGVFARQVATPNVDTQHFIKITKENNLETILFEYPDDKFTSKNNFKHSLCQIRVHNGINKNGNDLFEKINIIDLVKYDGKKIRDIVTLWEEPLIDFHRKLFKHYELPEDLIFHDISGWYDRNGNDASHYYTNFLLLFVCHGILFENFLTSKDSEGDFTKNIVLPSINEIENLTGVKPLIVPISLLDIENEEYWISHPSHIKKLIPKK